MNPRLVLLALVLAGSSCSKQPATVTLPPRLETYFNQYCDYTGGMGIGFDISDTYDYRFRQRLKKTSDPELKRLFVLQHLPSDIELALNSFERGVVRTGKTSFRPITSAEWQDTKKSIETQISDLASYTAFTNFVTANRDDFFDDHDPEFDSKSVKQLRERFLSITNVPAAK